MTAACNRDCWSASLCWMIQLERSPFWTRLKLRMRWKTPNAIRLIFDIEKLLWKSELPKRPKILLNTPSWSWGDMHVCVSWKPLQCTTDKKLSRKPKKIWSILRKFSSFASQNKNHLQKDFIDDQSCILVWIPNLKFKTWMDSVYLHKLLFFLDNFVSW